MLTFTIKPARADVPVRDPDTLEYLAAEGEEKPRTAYWMRRIAEGDVTQIVAKPKSKARTANKETK